MDAIESAALKRMIADSADVEVQLEAVQGCRPLVAVLQLARQEAAGALVSLIDVDPTNVDQIRKLQNEITRFKDLARWLSKVVADGFEADQIITAEEREELIEMIAGSADGQDAIDQIEGVEDARTFQS